MNKKMTISERINARLSEAPGAVFKDGKWRFWFFFLFGLGAVNGILTAMIFAGSIGGIALAVGGLICWVLVGTLYYSDSEDARLARGVSLLDSITLIFVVVHFCFLMWCYGHLIIRRNADSKYESQMAAYNDGLKNVSTDNVKIADAAREIAKETTKAERLRNDTAYQQRRAAEAGARVNARRQASGIAPSLATSPVELVAPEKPEESADAYLVRWDAWIRVANFGELILAAITLIYIRNRSARYNAPYLSGNAPRINFEPSAAILSPVATVAPLRQPDAKTATPVATVAEGQKLAVNALREHLRLIAFHIPNHWFKVDPIVGGVVIRLCRRESGREVTIKSTRQSNKILAAISRPDFRERLIDELKRQGFPIGKGGR